MMGGRRHPICCLPVDLSPSLFRLCDIFSHFFGALSHHASQCVRFGCAHWPTASSSLSPRNYNATYYITSNVTSHLSTRRLDSTILPPHTVSSLIHPSHTSLSGLSRAPGATNTGIKQNSKKSATLAFPFLIRSCVCTDWLLLGCCCPQSERLPAHRFHFLMRLDPECD